MVLAGHSFIMMQRQNSISGGMRDTFEIPNAEGNIRGYKGEKSYLQTG